jgi:GNAT superfamily N-acetyltransferase
LTPLNEKGAYRLRTPVGDKEWRTYHAIRRRVLFESRGLFGVYDENHPDTFVPGNHPLLLLHEGEAIGAIRVDVHDQLAIFRQIAIREDLQRRGHGRVMLSLAESFAVERGCRFVRIYSAPDVADFYGRCQYHRESEPPMDAEYVLMAKDLGASSG